MEAGVRLNADDSDESKRSPFLPDAFGEWWGKSMEITEKEHQVLGNDTKFARKEYSNGRGDSIVVSIVLAGEDMMTSIHRPERCMHAQGWEFPNGEVRQIDVPGKGTLPVMRLKSHKTERQPDGSGQLLENVCYYWFAGRDEVTASHMARARIDAFDRLTRGDAQRWAMMMIASNITGRKKFGRDEKETDELVKEFIRQLAPQIHREGLQYH